MVSILDKEKRKKKLRADAHEVMREKMRFSAALNTITKAEDALELIAETGDVGAYRLLLDSKWKRINKLLPDLKATEITGSVDLGLYDQLAASMARVRANDEAGSK